MKHITRICQSAAVGVVLSLGTTSAFAVPIASPDDPSLEANSVLSLLEQIEQYNWASRDETIPLAETPLDAIAQNFPNTSQFQDVSPTDWAFQALELLVERYNCLKGYPDLTFRGDRPLTRYEFAAGLNACSQQMERLLQEATADLVPRDEFAILERLQAEFAEELNQLILQVDDLEARIAFLEDNQFSTTTKLSGEVVFALTDVLGASFSQVTNNLSFLPGLSIDVSSGDFGITSVPDSTLNIDNDQEPIFGGSVRFFMATSFTGRDRLLIRGRFSNLAPFTANSNGSVNAPPIPPVAPVPINARFTRNTGEGAQTFNIPDAHVSYSFPIDPARVFISAGRAVWSDIAPTLNPYFQDFDGGNGALSSFASESPIYRIGGGAGAALTLPLIAGDGFIKNANVAIGYLAGPGANDATTGLFYGDYAALGQATFDLGDVNLGFTYVHGYHQSETAIFDNGLGSNLGSNGFVGTILANFPGSTLQTLTGPFTNLSSVPMLTNSYGFEASWRISDAVSLSGFLAYTDAILIGQGDSEIWTYGLGLAFPDLGGEGNLLGLFVGAQPYAGSIDIPRVNYRNANVPYHLELFYKYQLRDAISITPGIIWLPNANEINNDVFIATLRTTFSF